MEPVGPLKANEEEDAPSCSQAASEKLATACDVSAGPAPQAVSTSLQLEPEAAGPDNVPYVMPMPRYLDGSAMCLVGWDQLIAINNPPCTFFHGV